jgi:plastocyanin
MFKTILSAAALASAALAAPTSTTGGSHPTRTNTHLTGVTHTVVAGLGGLNFEPANVVAQVGDVIQWEFLPANHTVVQSNFADPCQPLADGSGFFPGFEFATPEGKSDLVFQIVVEDDSTIWYYCPQLKGEHCKKGMVGVINQNFDSNDFTLAKHKELAAKAKNIVVPKKTQGGKTIVNPNP